MNIDNGYAPITSMMTGGMPGWGTKNVEHIVAMYAYNQGSTNWVYYTETASQHAGFNGTYRNSQTRGIFYGYVQYNDSTVW